MPTVTGATEASDAIPAVHIASPPMTSTVKEPALATHSLSEATPSR